MPSMRRCIGGSSAVLSNYILCVVLFCAGKKRKGLYQSLTIHQCLDGFGSTSYAKFCYLFTVLCDNSSHMIFSTYMLSVLWLMSVLTLLVRHSPTG